MCGITGVFNADLNRAGKLITGATLDLLMMNKLQHRARDGAGQVSQTEDGRLHAHTGPGLAKDVFTGCSLLRLPGANAIGHLRYITTADKKNGQPFVFPTFAIAHNGNLTNINELEERDLRGVEFKTQIDTERLGHLITKAPEKNFIKALKWALTKVRGTYCLVILHRDRLIAVRDPSGNRPLHLGLISNPSGKKTWLIASEDCAFAGIQAHHERAIEPGEILIISKDGLKKDKIELEVKVRRAHCIFCQIYLGHPSSTIFAQEVGDFRVRTGQLLSQKCPVANPDIVVPVPDSANLIAFGFDSARPSPAIIRDHYVGRTFLARTQLLRELLIGQKFLLVKSMVQGKIVVLVDDSIVRLTTMPIVVRLLRKFGAKEIHVRIGCPPIRHPCRYGVYIPSPERLIAANNSITEIRNLIKADSLVFLTLEDLESLLPDPAHYCYACMTGNYPLPE